MIAVDFWGVKASGRCNTADKLRVLRSLLMAVHSRLPGADGRQMAFLLKLAKAPVRLSSHVLNSARITRLRLPLVKS